MNQTKQIEIIIEKAYHAMIAKGATEDEAAQAVNTIQMVFLNSDCDAIVYEPIAEEIDAWLCGSIVFSLHDNTFFHNLWKKLGNNFVGGFKNA